MKAFILFFYFVVFDYIAGFLVYGYFILEIIIIDKGKGKNLRSESRMTGLLDK